MATSTPVFKFIVLSIFFSSILIPSFACPLHQKQALLHFKSNLTAIYNSKYPVKFVRLDSWNSTSNCCSWERVNCSTTGSVTELHLSNVTFPPPGFDRVTISSDILTPLFHIRSLELLDISSNNLEGEIPGDGFGNHTKLLLLDMWDNNFNGSIPSQLFRLTNLRYLDMSYNHLDGVLSHEVGKLQNLESLLLYRNFLSGNIPKEIGKVTNLRDLDMRSNLLEGKLEAELGSLRNLSTLDLSYNHFQGQIPQLFELKSLQVLDLSDNKIGGGISPEIGELPENIGNAVNLGYLALSENHLSGIIPKSISNLTRLLLLDLSHNRFSGDSLPTFSANDRFLLDLSNNDFFGKIPTNFPKGTEILYLGGNKFSCSLPSDLTKLVNLRVLDLSNSIITGNLQDILPQFPTSLEILILRNTSLKGFIPNSISKCSSLRILDLSENNLTGTIPRQMANLPLMSAASNRTGDLHDDRLQDLIVNWKRSSRRLHNLRFFVMLDLSSNNIVGEIPTALGNLKALKQLNMSHNKLSGHIPWSLGNLESIESLDLSHNEISGSIPQSLKQLHELGTLDLSYNKLTGRIPSGGQMDTMNELSFRNNSRLCGMQINTKCPEDIPSSKERVEEEEDVSWMCWEGTWIGFPIGFFSTILIMSYLLNFIQLFKFW